MEKITTLHFIQVTPMNTHYIWSALNHLISLGAKYDVNIEYHTTHKTSDEFYDLYIDCPDGLVSELVVFYILTIIPELKYKK